MAITPVSVVNIGSGTATSLTAAFAGQPANGVLRLIASGCFFPNTNTSLSHSAPASLTTQSDSLVGGNLSSFVQYRTSNGSDGVNNTADVTPDPEGLGVWAGHFVGASTTIDTSGKTKETSSTSVAVTTAGTVTLANSLAIFIVFKRGNAFTRSWSAGWTEIEAETNTSGTRVEVFVATQTVAAGSAISGTFTMDTGIATRMDGHIIVLSPGNTAPTITAQASKRVVKNAAMAIPFTVADAEDDALVVNVGCTTGTLTAPLAAGAGVTVDSGSGTNALQLSGTVAQFTAMGSISYTQNGYVSDTITWDAQDTEPLSATQDTTAITMWEYHAYGADTAALNIVLAARRFTSSVVGTYTITMETEDASGNIDTDTSMVTVDDPGAAWGGTLPRLNLGLWI